MKTSRVPLMACVALIASLTGCRASNEESDAATESPPAKSQHVSPREGTLCILSVDCPGGSHCDLGECVQSCSGDDPCGEGQACSERGRCLDEGTVDVEPPPVGESKGVLQVDKQRVPLDETTTSFSLELTTNASQAVRYRVTTQAPYVAIAEKRGEFTGKTTLAFTVDPSKVEGREASGTIKIFTDLGERVVDVPIRIGVTGKYQGALRYTTNGVGLGDARIAVEILENHGDVSVLVDPEGSLLFPETEHGKTSGLGSYSPEGIEFSVLQRIDAGMGGTRNHFRRELGRRLAFSLKPNDLGGLEGTFKEKIYGLFDQPIELEGTVALYYRGGEKRPDFEAVEYVEMPKLEVPEPKPYKDCSTLFNVVAGAKWRDDPEGTFATLEGYYELDQAMKNRALAGRSYAELVSICETELLGPLPATVECAWLPALSCGVALATGVEGMAFPESFNRMVRSSTAPSLLIAQQYVVNALDASFVPGGLARERRAYEDAVGALGGIADWLLYPDVIAFMRGMSPETARGPEPTSDDEAEETYLAGRSLARLLQLLSTIDGERARIAGIDLPASDPKLLRTAQERALLALLEASTLLEITRNWGVTPDVITADLSGLLNPLDTGFGALLEGARAFGVPDGFVPFVWRAEDTGRGATNFEQMLALASESASTERALEDAYLVNARSFEDSEDELLQQMQNLALTYDSQIADLCGDSFDPDAVALDTDWEKCGAEDAGEVGSLLLQLELADARIQASQSRIQGQFDKITIDRDALARTQDVREGTLEFIEDTGTALAINTMCQGVVQAIQDSISVASNSQLWNVGAPVAMGAQAFSMGVLKAGLQVQRQQLETAQTMRFHRQDASLELINGMASIQKQLIDFNQLAVEILQDNLARQDMASRVNDAVARAKRLHALRRQAASIVDRDPSHDPAFRILRDGQALQLLETRSRAQRMLYLAARALEYEVNTPIASLGGAVLSARSAQGMTQLSNCLKEIHTSHRLAFGSPQAYKAEVSVREMLGIFGPLTDEVTGEELGAGQRFRLATQKSQAYDEDGALTITFSTNLMPNNGLWSTDVCGDRITRVRAQLVGDGLGDNEAQVNVSLAGAAVMRECDSERVQTWSMGEGSGASAGSAVIQAGVNSYGTAEPNASLYGQSVARASWQITIPPGSVAPSNADVDLSQLDDVVLEIEHAALPRRQTPLHVDTSCLTGIR